MISVKVVLAGFGNVGRSLIKLLLDKYDILQKRYGIKFDILAIGDSSGFVYKVDTSFTRSELEKLLQVPRGGLAKCGLGLVTHDIRKVLDETIPDFLVDLTPANYETGEPGLTYQVEALKRGIGVVTANKAPLVLSFRKLMNLAERRNVPYGYRATVFGGVPIVDMLRHLAAHEVKKVEGILNATTNFILTKIFVENYTLAQAIEEARRIGVMEANPALDLEGIDAAAKITIIANTLGIDLTLNEVKRRGISNLPEEYIEDVKKRGKCLKLLAILDVEKKEASVEPVELDRSDDLAQVNYLLNAVRVETDYNKIFLKGVGGGPFETAINVLSELVELACRWLGTLRKIH